MSEGETGLPRLSADGHDFGAGPSLLKNWEAMA